MLSAKPSKSMLEERKFGEGAGPGRKAGERDRACWRKRELQELLVLEERLWREMSHRNSCPLPCQILLFAHTKAKESSRRFFLQFLLQIQRLPDLLKSRRREWKRQPSCSCPIPVDPPPSPEDPQSIPSVPPTLQVLPTPSALWALLLSLHLPLLKTQTAPPNSQSDAGNRIQPLRKKKQLVCGVVF